MNITKNSHFIPQVYLKSWASDKLKINVYNLFAPSEKSPIWKKENLRKTSNIDYMYQFFDGKKYNNEIEEKFSIEVENKFPQFIEKINQYKAFTCEDKEYVAKLVLSQFYRNIKGYNRIQEMSEELFPKALLEVFTDLSKMGKNKANKNVKFQELDNYFDDIKLEIFNGDDKDNALLKVEKLAGKNNWLSALNLIMNKTYRKISNNSWQILVAKDRDEFLTSDNPVILMNYYSDNNYEILNSGFGVRGASIYFPLTPKRALYCHVGSKIPEYVICPKESIEFFNKIIVETATYKVYAKTKIDGIALYRKRIVNREIFSEITNQRKGFHNDYIKKELPFLLESNLQKNNCNLQ